MNNIKYSVMWAAFLIKNSKIIVYMFKQTYFPLLTHLLQKIILSDDSPGWFEKVKIITIQIKEGIKYASF